MIHLTERTTCNVLLVFKAVAKRLLRMPRCIVADDALSLVVHHSREVESPDAVAITATLSCDKNRDVSDVV